MRKRKLVNIEQFKEYEQNKYERALSSTILTPLISQCIYNCEHVFAQTNTLESDQLRFSDAPFFAFCESPTDGFRYRG